jgi:hypothetical protein
MLWDMDITRHARLAASVTGLALLLSACGGGGGGGKDSGVASLADGSTASASESAADDKETSEEQTLAWVQCMREQGLDIADPTVDSDGNLVLGGPRPGGGGGTAGSANAQPVDRDAFSKATENCGNPPQTAGGFSQEDRQAAQDSLLKMAQCLRDAGFDVADPDFSSQGPGGAPTGNSSSSGNASQARGPFGDLDMNDAKVQAAFTTCQAEVGTTFRVGRGAPAGGGGNG